MKKQEEEEHEEEESEDEDDDEEGGPVDVLADLPAEVGRRVKALRAMHDDFEGVHEEYRAARAEVEAKFAAKKQALFEARRAIVQGEKDVAPEEGAEAPTADSIKGVPDFWCDVLTGHPDLGDLIAEEDIPALSFLDDINVTYENNFKAFTLSFTFRENEFFTNKVLTKKYEVDPDLFDESPGLTDAQGCVIDWKAGKNLTMSEIKKKQKAKSGRNKGQVRTVTRTVPKPSFFNFFKSPIPQEGDEEEPEQEDNEDEEDQNQGGPRIKLSVEEDYDVGHIIRTTIVNEAVLYFTGEKDFSDMYGGMDEDDDEEEEDDEEDDEEEEEEEEEAVQAKGKKGKKHAAGPAAAAAGAAGEKPQECKQN